jgi:hypothetical protein
LRGTAGSQGSLRAGARPASLTLEEEWDLERPQRGV